MRSCAQEVEAAKSRLTQELKHPPTEEEIAKEVGSETEEYRNFLDQYSRAQVASLGNRLEIVDSKPLGIEYKALTEGYLAADPQFQSNFEELRADFAKAISELEKRESLVATFYFYEGLTLKEISKVLNLTEGRISQILRGALVKLGSRLQGSPLVSRGWGEKLG